MPPTELRREIQAIIPSWLLMGRVTQLVFGLLYSHGAPSPQQPRPLEMVPRSLVLSKHHPISLFLTFSSQTSVRSISKSWWLSPKKRANLPTGHFSRCFFPSLATSGFCLDHCSHLLPDLPASTLTQRYPFPLKEVRWIFKQCESDHGSPLCCNLSSSFSLYLE